MGSSQFLRWGNTSSRNPPRLEVRKDILGTVPEPLWCDRQHMFACRGACGHLWLLLMGKRSSKPFPTHSRGKKDYLAQGVCARFVCLLICVQSLVYLLILSSFIEPTLHRHKSAPEGSLHHEPGYFGHLRAYSLENTAFGIRPAHSLAVETMLTSILLSCLDAHPLVFVVHIKQNKNPKA